VAETANIAAIASRITHDIFNVFHWGTHSLNDTNFECVLPTHTASGDNEKKTHPGDVVFHYLDPYLNKRIYLHTDLKSYSKSTLKVGKIRDALRSLAMTVECASVSETWKRKYLLDSKESYEVRGLLFVVNHDNKAPASFTENLKKIATENLPIAKSQILHVLGPEDINNLYAIATDIQLTIQKKKLSSFYRFFYPDLTLWKRHTTDDERIGATIETLLSPYFILRHGAVVDEKDPTQVLEKPGSLVYYSRAGTTTDEFIYLLDSLLRYQLVNAKEQVRIRVVHRDRATDLKSNFERAKEQYCRSWKFQGDRESEIKDITIDSINQISANYSPEEIGWRVK